MDKGVEADMGGHRDARIAVVFEGIAVKLALVLLF
jgi:hypothetical protein